MGARQSSPSNPMIPRGGAITAPTRGVAAVLQLGLLRLLALVDLLVEGALDYTAVGPLGVGIWRGSCTCCRESFSAAVVGGAGARPLCSTVAGRRVFTVCSTGARSADFRGNRQYVSVAT